MKKLLALLLSAALVLGLCGCMSHIEDTNGPEDFSLATLTEEDILGSSLKSTTNMSTEKTKGLTTYCKAQKFSGVTDLYEETVMWSSGMTMEVSSSVTEGNARLLLLLDGALIHEFDINAENQTFTLDEFEGTITLRLAGESAKYDIRFSFL